MLTQPWRVAERAIILCARLCCKTSWVPLPITGSVSTNRCCCAAISARVTICSTKWAPLGANVSGAWTGLARNYYGLGLQYNAKELYGGVPVQWVGGYEFDRAREQRQSGAASLGQKSTTTRNEDNQSENSDFYVQGTALVNGSLSAVLGFRHSTVRFTSDDYYLKDGLDGSGNKAYSAVNPVVGVTFHATDDLNIYANYGRGFETPTSPRWPTKSRRRAARRRSLNLIPA
ncbi:MAG: TonB-dependent receptor [Betaproteobacteria bacterium]|nr:TonB-dependent receptor [Betaproteobacteria bacterium]